MRINKQINRKRKILITAVVCTLFLAGTVTAYTYRSSPHPSSKSTENTQTVEDPPIPNQEQFTDQPDNSASKEEAPNTDHPVAPNNSTSPGKKHVQMVASTDQSDDTLFIRGGINYPVSEGSCYAQLSGPSGQSIRKNSTILRNPASTDCKTLMIPKSELSSGNWSFTLHYESDDYEGVSDEILFTL